MNQRLRYEEYSNDPNWPKVPFPTKQQCETCVQQIDANGDALEFNKAEVYNYFKQFYYLPNSAGNEKYSFAVLFSFVLFVLNK